MSDYAVIIAARMSSTRLPGKAMAMYCPDGTMNLEQIVWRWQRHSRRDPFVIVATTADPIDDAIEALCWNHKIPYYRAPRGPYDDVLLRMDNAIRFYAPDAKWIARAMSDSPLVDVPLADWRRDILEETGADGLWYGPDHERITYAGTTDVWSRAAWDRIVVESHGDEREHPGLYYWRNLSRFSVVQLPLPMREYLAPIRTELDTPEDLKMFTQLWQLWHLSETETCIPTLWALGMIDRYPGLSAINAGVAVKTQTRAAWPKGVGFLCEQCQTRLGGIVSGDLEVRCARCGKPKKFYRSEVSNVRQVHR